MTDAERPLTPAEPAEPSEPNQAEPAETAEPAEPNQLADIAEPVAPAEPAEPNQLADIAEPVAPAEPAEPVGLAEPTEAAGGPTVADEPAVPDGRVLPGDLSESEAPAEPGASSGRAGPKAVSADEVASDGPAAPSEVASAEAATAEAPADDGHETPHAEAPVEEPAAPPPAPSPTVRRTVSQEVARQLYASGVRFCFTVPAEPILPLLDDLAAAGVRVVTTRHEGGAAFMAEALSQSTGRPQVVAVSRAVGAANAAIGIHTAQQDSAPLVALAGQVATPLLGREAFQETDLVSSVGSLAAWAAQIDAAEDAVAVLAKAWKHINTGRPGPVLLSVPIDVQTAEIELADEEPPRPPGARGPAADRPAVSRAMKMLASSERGVIVAGAGVLRARATKRLVALSEALAVPVIAAWRRPDVFPNDHANYLGMAGSWAAPTVAQRLDDADVILFIGTRLSEITTGGYAIPARDTRWIHVDVQPRVARAGLPAPTLAISADASRFLDSAWSDLRAVALDNEMRSRREARTAADREAYRAASGAGQGSYDGPGADPRWIMAMLRRALPDNATIATDAGDLAGFVARYFRFRRAGTFVGATSGTMGFGLPAAIAASLLDPDRIAVAICGDGGFAATMNELETAVREGAHPIAVVLDNQRYGSIASQQIREGRATDTTDLGAVDFAAIARAHGALGWSVSDDAAFGPALREAIASRRTSVIHVSVDRAWRSVDENPVTTPV